MLTCEVLFLLATSINILLSAVMEYKAHNIITTLNISCFRFNIAGKLTLNIKYWLIRCIVEPSYLDPDN